MGIMETGKSRTREKWGMGLLLVFFSDDNTANNFNHKNMIPRSNSKNLISTKTQSTISICILLVLITFLLFTLSSFEPTTITHHNQNLPRRILNQNSNPNPKFHTQNQNSPIYSSWVARIFNFKRPQFDSSSKSKKSTQYALQGMGTLFFRGTRVMNDLIVIHASMEDEEEEIDRGNRVRMFMRMLHRSGLTSRADTVILFPTMEDSSVFHSIVREENESFLKLVHKNRVEFNNSVASFDITQFVKREKDTGEIIWGKKTRGNNISNSGNFSDFETESIRYGSVVGFNSDELDPENSLSGFFNNVPMDLRKWACYPMLLGRVRRNYKHVMLVDMKNILLTGDPLSRIKNRSQESVFLFSGQLPKHGHKNTDKTKLVNPTVIMGGSRGVRRLSNFMLTEIVRSAMQQRKWKHAVTESGVLNQLVKNEFILKDSVKLIVGTELIPDASSLTGLSPNSGFSLALPKVGLMQRGSSNSIDFAIMEYICSFEVDSYVYSDCDQHRKSN